MTLVLKPIGAIRSPFQTIEDMPIQPSGAKNVTGRVELETAFIDGLSDLAGFSHIILLYHFHKSSGYSLTIKPFLDREFRGVFATRAPRRPNPVGLSVVRLVEIHENILHIQGVDVLDGTPLLDIKPYVPKFDAPDNNVRTGWLDRRADESENRRSDGRFQQ